MREFTLSQRSGQSGRCFFYLPGRPFHCGRSIPRSAGLPGPALRVDVDHAAGAVAAVPSQRGAGRGRRPRIAAAEPAGGGIGRGGRDLTRSRFLTTPSRIQSASTGKGNHLDSPSHPVYSVCLRGWSPPVTRPVGLMTPTAFWCGGGSHVRNQDPPQWWVFLWPATMPVTGSPKASRSAGQVPETPCRLLPNDDSRSLLWTA